MRQRGGCPGLGDFPQNASGHSDRGNVSLTLRIVRHLWFDRNEIINNHQKIYNV